MVRGFWLCWGREITENRMGYVKVCGGCNGSINANYGGCSTEK